MLSAIFIFLLMIFVIGIFYYGTKNTSLRLDLKNGYIWPILIYREIFMVCSGVLLALTYGVSAFDGIILNARDEDNLKIALLSVYAIFSFGLTLTLLMKRFDIKNITKSRKEINYGYRFRRFVNAAAFTGIILFVVASLFLSYQHAFLISIFTGEDLVSIRLRNSYESHLPSQVAQIISISWWIVSIYTGNLIYQKRKLKSIFYGLIAFLLASASGDKSSVMTCLMLMGISYFSIRGIEMSVRTILKIIFLSFPFVYGLLFFVVSLQIQELTLEKFNIYLLNRIGVGQMAGVFDSLAIPRLSGDFFWHMIPGASFFVDYVPYDKTLMMVTEGYGYAEMGVRNSLFISEAYGIGGYPLLIFSPIIVGASYAMGLFFLNLVLTKLFDKAVSAVYTLPLYILSSGLTGGFSSFALFKGLLLEIICLGVIWVFFQFFRISLRKNAD